MMNERTTTSVSFNSFLSKVFTWMFLGLLATTITSFTVASTNLGYILASNQFAFIGLAVIEIGLVFTLTKNIQKFSYATTVTLFMIYSIVNGLTLSIIFFAYNIGTIAYAFGISTILFGVMALYGLFTKTDLSPFRTFFMIAIIGIIAASVINMFLSISGLDYIITLVGVVIFAGLTAYDMQKLKSYYMVGLNNTSIMGNLAVSGALALYLDFINLFLYVLRLVSRKK